MKPLAFLETYREKTRQNYRTAYNTFFSLVLKRGVKGNLEQVVEEYFTSPRNHQEDIQTYFLALKDRPPKSIQTMLAAVKTLLTENNVELSAKFWKSVTRRIRGTRAWTQDKVPSNRQLKDLLIGMPIHGRAFFLTMASSGMRIGEVLKLRLSDIDMSTEPAMVTISPQVSKTGNGRTCFISHETKTEIEKWLTLRVVYLEQSSTKTQSLGLTKSLNDNRVFPFTEVVAREIWLNTLKRAGLAERDENTGVLKIHPHVLRKFFRSRLATVISPDIVEALMGHEEGLTEVYRRYTPEQLAAEYVKGEYTLSIFTDQHQVAKLKNDLDEAHKQIGQALIRMQNENDILQKQVKTLTEKVDQSQAFHQKFLGLSETELDKLADLIRDRFERRSEESRMEEVRSEQAPPLSQDEVENIREVKTRISH